MKSKILLAAAIVVTTASVVLAAAVPHHCSQEVCSRRVTQAPVQELKEETFSSLGNILIKIQ